MTAPHPIKQAALLAQQGFRVMPTIDKVPLVEGFGADASDATWGREWFGESGTEVAILCGPCPALEPDALLVIDIDGDPNDHTEMSAFLSILPSTLASHRGRHLFFRVPKDFQNGGPLFKRAGRPHDGLDLKWAGGYVRESWDWQGANPEALASAIAALPPAALAAIQVARGARTAPTPVHDSEARGDAYLGARGFDPAMVRQDAIRWLQERAPVPDDGSGSSAALVVCGALMIGFGLSDVTTLELLLDVYAPRAWPGEDPDEEGLSRKIDEIDRLGSERFEDLELAVLWREVRRGTALTAPPPPVSAVLLDARQPAATGPVALSRQFTDEEYLATCYSRLKCTSKGVPLNLAHNTATILELHPTWRGMFGFDEFTQRVRILRSSPDEHLRELHEGDVFLADRHPTGIRAWFGYNCHEPSKTDLIDAVHHVARDRPFHVVRQYLEGLRGKWDGVDRNLSEYLGAEQTPYARAVCAKWLRSAVARAMVPGCKADTMLILEGNQGALKSTALKSLCPNVKWFYEVAGREAGSKDFLQDMSGKWLCEIAEVDGLIRSRDESDLKALLSRVCDTYRPSYARESQDFPRQLIFAGSANTDDYLRDHTGNRRYWPVACGADGPIHVAAICDDRDQLWAQAVTEYDAGEIWWLADEERVQAEDEQADRLGQDPWASSVIDWLDQRQDGLFTISDALAGLQGARPAADLTQYDLNRMAKLLRQLGCVNERHRTKTGQLRMWRRAT